MKTVNLLPAWYTQQHRRSKLMRLHLVTMLLLGGAMFGATELGHRQVAQLNQRRDALARQLEQVRDPDKALAQAQSELRRLEELRLARKELGNTVPMSAVIQQLRNEMRSGMALSDVAIDVRSEPVKGSGVVGDPRNPPRYRDVAHLTVTGISPDDQKITRFIDQVSRNPLFAGVTLDFIRTGTLQGYTVRKFEILIDMDMELLNTEAPEALATATPVHTPAAETGDANEH